MEQYKSLSAPQSHRILWETSETPKQETLAELDSQAGLQYIGTQDIIRISSESDRNNTGVKAKGDVTKN